MRLFIALLLPDEVIAPLETLQDRFPTGRPVPAENLHLTLAFLGDQPDEVTQAVHEGLETLRGPAPCVTLAGGAIFGGRHGQAVGLNADGGAALRDLHDRVQARLRGSGLTPERRRFRPHVTLARLKGHDDATRHLTLMSTASIGPFACTAFGLFASTLHPQGAIHEELARYPLAALPRAGAT